MSYYYDNEETEYNNQYSKHDELEYMFEKNMKLANKTLTSMKDCAECSNNPWILENCTSLDLYKFIETGEFELPKYYNKLDKKDLVCIPEPIESSQSVSTNDWITLKSTQQELIDEDNKKEEELFLKRKIAAEEYQKLLKVEQEKARARTEANKHNWTMSREQRGLPKDLPKPIPVEPKKPKLTRNQRRKLSKKKFQVNKNSQAMKTLTTIQEVKPKRKFGVNKSNPARETSRTIESVKPKKTFGVRRVSHKYE